MQRPNIILIVLDTVRADRLSCYGYHRKTSPCLDKIAAEGVLYEQAITPANWTLPSHVSMFTGLFPSKHGAHRAHQRLDTQYMTLAELLTKAGYRTAGFSSIDWLEEKTGANRGFSEYYGRAFRQSQLRNTSGSKRVNDKRSNEISQEVQEWLKNRNNDTPFFLFVNLFDAHNPYNPPEPHRSLFLHEGDSGRIPQLNWDITKYYAGAARMDNKDFSLMSNLYDGGVHYVDSVAGELVEFFRDQGILDESILFITSDHGENIGDHGHWGHRYCLYDSLIRVPLIIRYPGIFEGGKRPDNYVQTVDIYPTVMDLLSIDREDVCKELQGETLFPSALGSRKREFTLSEFMPKPDLRYYDGYPEFDASVFAYGLTAIRYNGYKLIWSSTGRHELYDLTSDPGEARNVYSDWPDKVSELSQFLKQWQMSFEASGQVQSYSLQSDPEVDEDIKNKLKALGYVE